MLSFIRMFQEIAIFLFKCQQVAFNLKHFSKKIWKQMFSFFKNYVYSIYHPCFLLMSPFCLPGSKLNCNVSLVLRLGITVVSLGGVRFWVQTTLGFKSRCPSVLLEVTYFWNNAIFPWELEK